ncbi:MAG: hypothetical protein IJF54_07575 [Clostridia bacterium]|nr:hypothetical protein [Clostridia bacterium]
MNEFTAIKNNQDIAEFLDKANGLHDGYIISVKYSNNGIKHINGGYTFNPEFTELAISILVTSINDTAVELLFENIDQWQIKEGHFEITETAISFTESGSVIWTDDCSTSPEFLNEGSYVIAKTMKWRINNESLKD